MTPHSFLRAFALLGGSTILIACSDTVAPPSLACAAPLVLSVGEATTVDGAGPVCVRAEADGDYASIHYFAGPRDTITRGRIIVRTDGLDAPRTNLATIASPEVAASKRDRAPALRAQRLEETPEWAWRMKLDLREQEKELYSLVRNRAGSSAIAGARPEATAPAVGSSLSLDVSTGCSTPDVRTGVVRFVTDHAIVVDDASNPPTAFSETQLQSFAQEFDELVYPTLTETFGEPTDIDGNGRVILFWSRGVNELTPPGGAGVVAGYFWAGDLFPRSETQDFGACASSNVGEVLYLAVPDPAGAVGGAVSEELLSQFMVGTIGHELQHLVNASRRLRVNGVERPELTWLNEALSFVAEEELFYRSSGLRPGENISSSEIVAGEVTDPFERFAVGNLGRYNQYLIGPRFASPFDVDGITTRGASWHFLRYALDRSPREDGSELFDLVNASTQGMDNLGAVLGSDPVEWMADWHVTVLADDLVPQLDPRFRQESWNTRELVSALRVDGRFPLELLDVPGEQGVRLDFQTGAAAYIPFSLRQGAIGTLDIELGTVPPGATGRTTIVRLR